MFFRKYLHSFGTDFIFRSFWYYAENQYMFVAKICKQTNIEKKNVYKGVFVFSFKLCNLWILLCP